MAETFRNSVDHHKQNRLVVIWQLIIFALAFLLGTFTKLLLPGIPSEILFKFVDVLFISGTILLAVKLAREGWDLAAAGFTILGVGWGVFFASIDFFNMDVADEMITSPLYFFIPCMLLISCYKPFPIWIKALNIWCIVPYLVAFIQHRINPDYLKSNFLWMAIGFISFHTVSLIWGIFFMVQYLRESNLHRKKGS
ncbi:MAG: hypothetical protein K1X63_07355 [Chitinophagales bacterium]|nr:hypothetical protein [Bacteroidota bacterium]MBX7140877.1 hypothetical protein [Chitinophagales bacterium]